MIAADVGGKSAEGGRVHDTGRGLTLAFIGGMALSFDIPLIRLAGADPFMVMGARGFGLAIMLFLYWRFLANRNDMPPDLLSDRNFLIVGTLSGLNNVCFTLAVFNTSTANVVFILAFNAMLAALLSWWMMGETPRRHTVAAILATTIGVLIIVGDSVSLGNWRGDLLALCCAMLLALSLTLTRRSGRDLSLAPGFGGMVSGLFALPMIIFISPWPEAPLPLIVDALIIVPIAGVTLWLAPRFIPAPQVALFYLLETVLAPIWVWMVFFEVPGTGAMIGGAIVLIAMLAHTMVEISQRRQRRRAALRL